MILKIKVSGVIEGWRILEADDIYYEPHLFKNLHMLESDVEQFCLNSSSFDEASKYSEYYGYLYELYTDDNPSPTRIFTDSVCYILNKEGKTIDKITNHLPLNV